MGNTIHTPGSFCTSVLRTRDPERAASFYGSLMGWTSVKVSEAPAHRLLQFNGKTVASIQPVLHGSDQWVPHVLVENIERTTADALTLGARLVDQSEVPHMARMATIRDAEDTVFGLWQPAPHRGVETTDEVGSLWWIEVLSNHVADARAFYSRLFDWTCSETAFEPFPSYIFFKRGDTQESGILPIGPNWGVPPRWNSIFSVNDCDRTLESASQLGGSAEFVHTVPRAGRIGIIRDPGGAVFVVRGPVPS